MLPLERVCVVAVERYGAGPIGTLQLADRGAEVVKVENIAEGGDIGLDDFRQPKDPLPEGDSLFFQAFNRNKHSLALDLKQEAGQEVLGDLVRSADGLLNNLRGGTPAGPAFATRRQRCACQVFPPIPRSARDFPTSARVHKHKSGLTVTHNRVTAHRAQPGPSHSSPICQDPPP